MLIGIEAERANHKKPTGVEHYAKQLILALAKSDRENDYILYLRTRPADWLLNLPPNFKCKVMPFPVFWTQLRISWELIWHPVDALLIMASALPIVHPKNSVVTIHDLAWQFYPEAHGFFMRTFLRLSTWYACKFANKVIAVSENTKRDLIAKYGLKPEKARVIYHGFDMHAEQTIGVDHSKISDSSEISSSEELAKISSLPEKFILYLGTLQPRKNIIGLIDAYLALKREKNISHALVIAGGKGWLYEKIMEKINGHPEVIYLGYVVDRLAVIKKASLLVQPAFYEGFGLTVLDAFAFGVLVACSNVSSLPEVAGDAAVYFDPKDQADMQASIYRAITDEGLRKELSAKGAERLKKFTWEKCAQETIEVLIGNS